MPTSAVPTGPPRSWAPAPSSASPPGTADRAPCRAWSCSMQGTKPAGRRRRKFKKKRIQGKPTRGKIKMATAFFFFFANQWQGHGSIRLTTTATDSTPRGSWRNRSVSTTSAFCAMERRYDASCTCSGYLPRRRRNKNKNKINEQRVYEAIFIIKFFYFLLLFFFYYYYFHYYFFAFFLSPPAGGDKPSFAQANCLNCLLELHAPQPQDVTKEKKSVKRD